MLIWGKIKKKPKNDEEEEDDVGSITVKGNHIYFYADVEAKSIQTLVQALLDLNKPGNMYREIWMAYVYSAARWSLNEVQGIQCIIGIWGNGRFARGFIVCYI